MNEVVGTILVHLEFFEDDAFLFLKFIRIEDRLRHHVADDVDDGRQMLIEHLSRERHNFLGGESV